MAQDQKKITTGGNKPKPPAGSGGTSQSAKDRSKAQSRPVSGKAPTGKAGQASGTAKKVGTRRDRVHVLRPRPHPDGCPVPCWPGVPWALSS